MGTKVYDDFPLEELRPYIDWTPFFQSWELAGRYPAILKDPVVGGEARRLFDDAQEMLEQIIAERWIKAKAVVGFFPANTVADDDVEVYQSDAQVPVLVSADKVNGNGIAPEAAPVFTEDRTQVIATLHHMRQQNMKAKQLPNLSLADFVAPKDSGREDYIGGFVVTAGIGAEEVAKRFEDDHDDYNSIMVKALADRLAEAFAEKMHVLVRKELWGYQPKEALSNEDLIREKYAGIRPAPGYPACPDHLEKRTLFDLLNAEEAVGVTLTESYAMFPAASVSGWYFAHPESKYFGVGKIAKDQIESLAERKGLEVKALERWLSSNLSYDD